MDDIISFEDMPRQRKAEFFTPPNVLKQKVGDGGITPELINQAEEQIQNNTQDFAPIAMVYFEILDKVSQEIKAGKLTGSDAFEAVLYPLSQLKAQGALYNKPIISDLAAMLINFLEVIHHLDDAAVSIIMAHKMTLQAVISKKTSAEGETKQNKALQKALREACIRYFQKNK